MHLLGHPEVSNVSTTIGPEQEYFLVDRKLYEQRTDLILPAVAAGAMAPKGQEMEDHYLGTAAPCGGIYARSG